jgi:hypothetical protein
LDRQLLVEPRGLRCASTPRGRLRLGSSILVLLP